jgi:hypothetical protein
MKAIYFKGANDVIGRPSSATADQCDAAIVHRGTDSEYGWPVITLCWEPSEAEKEEFLRTGKLYQMIFSQVIPMQSLSVHNPVTNEWVKDGTPLQPEHPLLKNN